MSFIENVNDPYHRGFQSIRQFSEKSRSSTIFSSSSDRLVVKIVKLVEIARVVKYIKMVNYNDGENEIFVISKKFEEIKGETFQNHSTETSPIVQAKTNLAPEVSKN